MDNAKHKRLEGGKRYRNGQRGNAETTPLISIITAVYNGSATIGETIKSISAQTFTNFEYIIIDGGSTDGTLDILRKHNDEIDYWVSAPDNGIYDAFNKGIDLAKGDWLYFIGADDRLFDNSVLEKVFSKSIDSEFLYGNVFLEEEEEIVFGKFLPKNLYMQNICQQAIFYNKRLFQRIGKFNLKYQLLADWDFNIKAFGLKSTKPYYLDTVVAVYSIYGMSNNVCDIVFLADRERLFRETFGTLFFVRQKVFFTLKSVLNYIKNPRKLRNLLARRKKIYKNCEPSRNSWHIQ